MKRKLLFITLLMLFCSTMFGQGPEWQAPTQGTYEDYMSFTAMIQIDGANPNRSDLKIAAFNNGIVRGVGTSQIWNSDVTIVMFKIYGDKNDVLNFKLYVPGDNPEDDRILDTDFTIKLDPDYTGTSNVLNFYKKHFVVDNEYDLSMTVGATVRIDGVDPKRTDLDLAAFCGDEVRGVAKAIYWQSQDMYYYELIVGGRIDGEEITYKLYDPIADVDLLTDYKTTFKDGSTIDDGYGKPVTIEFKNKPVARIGEEGNAARYFSSLEAAVDAAQPGETVVLLQDVNLTETLTIDKSITIDLNEKNVTLSTGGNMINSDVTIKNGNLAIADVDTQTTGNSNCFISTNVGASLTFDDINMTGNGYTTHWAVLCAMSSSTAGSTINITNSTVTLSNEKGLAGGFIKDQSGVDNYSQINISNSTLTLTNVSRGFTGAKVTLDDVEMTITGGEHGINGSELVIKNGSNVSISNGTGRAITLNKYNASITGSNVTISNMGEGGIRYKTANTLTVDANSTLSETKAHADVDNAKLNDKVVRGTESQMSTVKVENGVTTVINPVSGQVAYRAYIEDSENREAVKVDLQNVNALSSLAVKLYDANGNLLTITTYRAGAVERPGYLTCNIVLWGEASSSWETVISAEKLTVDNYPHKAELVVDGNVINTFENILGNATDAAAYQLPAYKALGCVYKAASITREGKTEYYGTLAAAVNAAQNDDVIVLLNNVSDVDATISKKVTLNLNEKTITDAAIIVSSEVLIKNGDIKNTNEPYPVKISSNGKLTIEGVDIEASKSDRAIWVDGGELIFNSGSILATKGVENNKTSLITAIWVSDNSDVTINDGTITVDTPDNQAVGIFGNYENANVTINGGKISTSGKNYSYAINVDGDITVTGGEIVTNEKGYGYSSGIRYGNNYALVTATGNVTISGGKITTNSYSGYIVSVGRSYSEQDQTVTITGGEFKNNLSEVENTTGGHKAPVLVWDSSKSATVEATISNGQNGTTPKFEGFNTDLYRPGKDGQVINPNSTLLVSGGTFDVAIEGKYIAPGFKLEENENGTYGVVVDPEYGMQAKIVKDGTTTYYTTIADAITAAQPGETVTILDGEYTADITINKVITVVGERDEQGNNLVKITGRVSAYTGATVKYLNVNNTKTGDYDCALNVNGKDIVVDGVNLTGYNAMRYCYASGNITIKNSTIKGSNFAVHFDGSEGGNIVFEDTDITGWASYASTVNNVSYTGCYLDQGSYFGHRYYNKNISFTDCTFKDGLLIDLRASGSNVAFTDEDMTVAEVKALFKDPYYVAKGNVTLNGDPVLYAASANSKYYNTLQECIDDLPADGTNWYVTLRSDNVLTAPITIPADKKMIFALNGFDITYTSDVQGDAMITNNGVLTIEGSDDDKVAYKFTGTPDTSYGKGNYTIYNNGTLTVESGIVENTTDAMSHASYAINTGAGATLNIKGGKVLNLNGHAVRMVSFGTNVNNVDITGGYIEGTRALQVQLPGDATSTTKPEMNLSISGGELKSNEETYNLAIYVYSNGQSAENLNVAVEGGTFNGNVAINEVATKTMKEDAVKVINGTFNGAYGVFSYADNAVAVPVISITGGTFATDYSEAYALDDGYEFVKDETTGRFGLQQLQGLTISTLNELIAFRNAVNAGNTFEGQTVVLSGNVDLAPTRAAAENWIPIGTSANPFKGTFDGGDNTISNLVVEGENNVGLFGYADNATIKNVKLENVNVKGTNCVGAIAGQVFSTSLIDNCHVSGSIQVEGQTNVGGIVGKYYTKVKNCSVIGDDVATSYVKGTYAASDFEGDNIGGIMGHGGEDNRFENNTVKNITISGTRKVAGIVGVTDMNTQVKNCVVENVNIETTATTEYANSKKNTMSNGTLVGSYTTGNNTTGTVESCVVKNVNFLNPNNAVVSVGPITGGLRGGTDGMLAPTGVTASGNNIYMSTITGSNNLFLMNPVAKIGTTEYYTLFDAVAAVQDGETTITMLRNTSEEFAINNTTANITLDMAGFTLTGAITPSEANLTIKNGTINNENASYSAIEINAGTLVLNNDVKVTSKRHGVRIDGAVTATINGGEYTLNATSGTRHAVNVSGAANVTIKDGKFVGPKGTTMDSGSAVCVQAGATVTIEGGDFSKGKNATLGVSGTMIVKGGTFDQDPSAYLADAYTVNIENEMYVVRYTPIMVTYPVGNPVYPEGKVEYYSDMLEAVPYTTNYPRLEGATITLLADVSGAGMRFMENDMVFDLNGHTYTITAGTGSQGTNTSGFQIRPEVTTNVLFKNGTIKVAEGAPVVWMFNCYATDFIVENVTVDCSNMAYSYGDQVYVVVSREGDNVQLTGETKIVNFNSDVAGNAINVGGTMTIGEEVDLGVNAVIKLGGGAQLTAPEDLNVVTVDGYMVVYENGVYKSVKVVAQVGDVKYESVAAAMTAAKEAGVKDLEITIIGENTQDTDDSFNLSYATAFDNVTIKQDNDNKPFYIKSIYTGDRTSTDGKFVFDGVNMIITEQIWFECDVVLTNNSSVKRSNDVKNFIYYGEVTVEPGSKYISQIDDVMAGSFTVDGGKTDGTYNEAEDFKTVFFDVRDGHTFTAKNGANILISSGEGGKLSLMGNANIDASKVYVYNEIALGDNGKFALDIESSVTTKNVTGKGVISVDALNINEGVVYNVITANMSSFAGIIEINNDDAEYEITSTGLVVKMKPFVAQVEDEKFTSLQAAIDAADGKTVVVLDNITLTETVTVAAGTTVTLDLNGKNLTGGADVNLVIKGELTIEDNVGNAVSTFRNHRVSNGGKLTLKSGILQNIETNTGGYGILIDEGGESTIEGGTVQAVNESNYAICVNGTLTIVDGNIVGKHGVIAVENQNAIVTIKDGEYTLNAITGKSDHIVYVYAGMVNIEDGNFTFNNFIANEGDSMIYAAKENVSITGGTYTHDVNNYCHKYYAAIQGDDNLWRVEQVLFAQTREFISGWNWFSSYINLSKDNGLSKLQNAIVQNYENGVGNALIKGQTNNQSVQYDYIGTLEGVDYYDWTGNTFAPVANKMYMIYTSEAIASEDFMIEGEKVDYENTTIALFQGWNWISYPLDEPTLINEALKNFTGATTGDQIKWYGTGFVTYANGKWYPENFKMMPGEGYMYKAAKQGSFMYSKGTGNNRSDANANMTVENSHWSPEISQYANNMTITAMLSVDDEIVKGDYEIAAFANGECRGSARPIYVEELDAYVLLMAVFGEDVEELTFKYYDVNYETEYELSNRINYSNDAVVGSIDEPYMFNLDILNIGETSVENISIYPNPTTIGSEINLQAVCDKVEVFNALGVKVAEYTNVDSIDAIETAGVYVIRLTIDNSARNCRLIVK